jgi:serine/threonine-protein kinase
MGAVFEARHEHLGSRVALKFLLPDLAEREGLVARFLQEARVSAAIRSPYVTQVMDVDQTPEGAPYLVMELLEGESLEQRLSRGSPLPPHDALEIGVQILSALEAAHSHGVVHRDLKPDNVWLSPSPSGPHVKLLDFGIAKIKVSSEYRQMATRPGSMMGTPAYMAPEQAISADQVDARADLYSFGVILYEMLSGKRPVDADDPATILEKLVRGEIHPLASRTQGLPPALCALVDRLVAPNPDERPASASYVRGELARFVRVTDYTDAQRPSMVPPTVPPLDQGAPPFVTSAQAAVRTNTAYMPQRPDMVVAPTAVATAPPLLVPPPRKRGATGAVLLTLFVALLGGGGAWAYMNQSIFDDSEPPPLPLPLPLPAATTAATVGQSEQPLPEPQPPAADYRPRPEPAPAVRPTAQPVQPSQPATSQTNPVVVTSPTAAPTLLPHLPLPTFSLPSSLPILLPTSLPPFLQQLPGFSPPAGQQPVQQAPAPTAQAPAPTATQAPVPTASPTPQSTAASGKTPHEPRPHEPR